MEKNKITKECLFFEELLNLLNRYDVNIYHLCDNEDLEQMNKTFHTNLKPNDLPFPMLTFEFANKRFIQDYQGDVDSNFCIGFVNENDQRERYIFNSYNSDKERRENDLFLAVKEVNEAFPAGDYKLNEKQNLALNHLNDVFLHYSSMEGEKGNEFKSLSSNH